MVDPHRTLRWPYRSRIMATSKYRQSSLEPLEPRTLLAGVTLITHGFEFSAGLPNWLSTMETSLSNRMGGANIYRLTITGSTPSVSSFTRIAAGGVSTGESIIDVDWSAVANNLFHPSVTTDTIANLVKPYLATALNLPGDPLTAHPFAELPIQLAGHSRGASLVTDLASKLAADGIWVDQVTTWDPYPVGSDPAVNLTDNVVFADNTYQNNSFPSGSAVSGSHNLNLTGISGIGHSETHAFYEGTIDRAATTDGDGITINNTWYTSAGVTRATAGYDFSRIGSAPMPADGLANLAGGSATRTHISVTAANPWSNVGSLDLTGDLSGLASDGAALDLTYRYQDSAGAGTISFYLDNDSNPYDGFAQSYGSTSALAATGATPNVSTLQDFPLTWSSSGLTDGTYRFAARITAANGQMRYAYMTDPVYVTSSGLELLTRRFSNNLANASWTDPSNFTPGGVPVAGDHVWIPTGTLSIASDQTNRSLIAGPAANLSLASAQDLSGLTIAAGARVAFAAGGNASLNTARLSLATGATLDLNDNDLVITTAAFSDVQNAVFVGYSDTPNTAATGIISTTSQNAGGNAMLLLFDNSQAGASEWPAGSGHLIAPTAIVGKYTYFGDTNLDGQVTGDDYAAIDAMLGTTGINPGIAVLMGDTNFDYQVTGDDYGAVDANLGLGAGNPLAIYTNSATTAQAPQTVIVLPQRKTALPLSVRPMLEILDS